MLGSYTKIPPLLHCLKLLQQISAKETTLNFKAGYNGMIGRMGFCQDLLCEQRETTPAVKLRGRDRKTAFGQTGKNRIFGDPKKSLDFLERRHQKKAFF